MSSHNPGFPSSKKDTINTFKQNTNDLGSKNPTVKRPAKRAESGEDDMLVNFNGQHGKQVAKKAGSHKFQTINPPDSSELLKRLSK